MLMLELTKALRPEAGKCRTLAACAAVCRSRFSPGMIRDEGEVIATVNDRGVVRDLDGKVVVLS